MLRNIEVMLPPQQSLVQQSAWVDIAAPASKLEQALESAEAFADIDSPSSSLQSIAAGLAERLGTDDGSKQLREAFEEIDAPKRSLQSMAAGLAEQLGSGGSRHLDGNLQTSSAWAMPAEQLGVGSGSRRH